MITLPATPTPWQQHQRWGHLPSSARGMIVASLAEDSSQPIVVLCRNSASAYQLEQALSFFTTCDVQLLPDWETLPYDSFSPHEDIISERLKTLSQLPGWQRGILIVPITTLMQRLAPPSYVAQHSLQLKQGDTLDLAAMRLRLERSGYRNATTVYQHGEYALRGAILDIFPMGAAQPLRIELLDDEIDSIRQFDPETQRGTERIAALDLLPAKEFPLDEAGITLFRRQWHERFNVDHRKCSLYQDVSDGIAPAGVEYYLSLFFEQTATLFDYLPKGIRLITEVGTEDAARHYWQDINQRFEQRQGDVQRPVLPPSSIFQTVPELFANLKPYPRITLCATSQQDESGGFDFPIEDGPELSVDAKADSPLAALKAYASTRRILLCAESAGRREALRDLLRRQGMDVAEFPDWQAFKHSEHPLGITVAALEGGFSCDHDARFALVSESQLFGRRVAQNRRRKKATSNPDLIVRNLAELRPGSPVVHADHGVGRYLGLQTLDVDSQANEFLTLEYAEGSKLYVPVSNLHLISRYSGSDEDHAPLHRLGSDQWSRAKRKAAEKIRDVAAELLDIYAKRGARQGRAFALDEADYQLFAEAFPFEETPDQKAAIEAVIADMKASQPMDRLVCGDVGFGKTEVAVRAAFIAVQNNSQVVMLVPTTLLAQQHFESFRDRFADLPVTVEVLSRFRSAGEQKDVLQRLADGKVDILIGTHKLLSSEIKYRELGLVIIDEEHRFGVRQKEALKNLRAEVDILTLTATPIPRTLNMSMSGIRDLSIIATPPARRLSVKTFVREHDDALVKEAILREILRGGQVYYLHNEVKTISKVARDLQEMLPELRIGIGHGQMRERDLEQVMSDFYHRRHNLLVCSTIIETGIDVPNANTIIIDRADKFGLAQLHQLRGRVGRSHHQAYAYLLTPPAKQLTTDAQKRLQAISEADDLGAGFTLATHDMEIRGAGELLGEEQSGQIHSIGFTLYMDMLDRAVNAIKSGRTVDLENSAEDNVDINLRLSALIPDDYLPDVQSRLMIYKRIASAQTSHALQELQVEMIDRFGLLPEQTKNLFRVAELRLRGAVLGISKIEFSAGGGRLEFNDRTEVDPLKLVKLVQSAPAQYQFDGATALKCRADLENPAQRFEYIEDLLGKLEP